MKLTRSRTFLRTSQNVIRMQFGPTGQRSPYVLSDQQLEDIKVPTLVI